MAELARACAAQRGHYTRGEPTDSAACFALFQRAIVEGDDAAWRAVHEAFGDMVRAWVLRLPPARASGIAVDVFANGAWHRLARYVTPERFADFASLAALLEYLRRCAAAEVFDTCRRIAKEPPTLVAEVAARPSADGAADLDARITRRILVREAWTCIDRQVIRDERERAAFRDAFTLGLTPRDTAGRFPRLFDSAAEVSRVKENVIARLRRPNPCRELLGALREEGV